MKTIFKNIFTGIIIVIIAAAIIVGLIAVTPVLLIAGGTVVQIGGWIVLFGVVFVLPVWGIGKLRNAIKNKRKPARHSEEEEEIKISEIERKVQASEERYATRVKAAEEGKTIDLTDEVDYETAIKMEYEEKYKASVRARYEQEYKDKMLKIDLKKAKKEAFNRKITNLKNKAKTFKNDVTDAVTELVK